MSEVVAAAPTEAPESNIAVDEINPFQTQDPVENIVEEKPVVVEEKKEPIVEDKKVDAAATTEPKKEPIVEDKKEPTTAAEIQFANDASKKYFELIKNGEEDKLYEFLHEQRTLSTVDKLSPEAQIKLNLQYQHPDFNQEEIEDLFAEQFHKPEKPEQGEFEDDDEYKSKVVKWEKDNKKFENKVGREAKVALKQLASKKAELVLPDIPTKGQAAAPEPTAEEIAEQKKVYDAYLQSVDKGLSEFNGFSTVFKEGNLELPINIPIPDDEKSTFKDQLQNFNVQDYFRNRWLNEDGTWNGKVFAEDVYWMTNRDKIMPKLATQAANQRIEHHLKEQKNIDFSGGRQQGATTSVASEQDAMVDYFLSQR